MTPRRCWLVWLLGFAITASQERAAVPELLQQAIAGMSPPNTHWAWAYTETTVVRLTDSKQRPIGMGGAEAGVTKFRFDPSKPYAEQFTPILVNGKAPGPKDFEAYRRRGLARADALAKRKAREASGKLPPQPGLQKSLPINLRQLGSYRVSAEQATLESEDARSATYTVPVQANGKAMVPAEALLLELRVDKASHTFRRLTFRIRDSFRVFVLFKVSGVAATVDLAQVDPRFPPVITKISVGFGFSFLFKKVNGSLEGARTDYALVPPVDDRFEVKVGPLKEISF